MPTNLHSPAVNIKIGKKIRGDRFTYTVERFLASGGSGVVYVATCIETKLTVAIKFFLPLYELNLSLFDSSASQQRALQDATDYHRKELECLRQASHPSVVRLIDNGTYSPPKTELISELSRVQEIHFFVTEYVDGRNISDYLKNASPSEQQLAEILIKLCDALVYLHDVKHYLHADIRPENILIRADTCDPVLIDFALYKNFNRFEADQVVVTNLAGDWDLFPRDLPDGDPLKAVKERRRTATRDELRELCFPALDLFQVGKLLNTLRLDLSRVFSQDGVAFLRLMEDELTNWARVRHLSARWLRDEMAKLIPSYSYFMGVEELAPPSSARNVQQLPGRTIVLSSAMDDITNTRSFRRLRSINQLALIDLIYPGAAYRRNLHCLRAYGFMSDLLQSLTHTPRFRLLFSPTLARQALAVALLHDINHFPFLHVFQESRGDYIRDIDLLNLFCDGKATGDSPSIYDLIERLQLDRQAFRDLLLSNHHQIVQRQYEPGLHIIKSLIDSGADVDKLAYLTDDSDFTGVSYGKGIDTSRLVAAATIIETTMDGTSSWHLAFREVGLPAVESLVMARYWMFRTVYWHRTNRAIMSMLLYVINKLYVEARANAGDFVVDTMWMSEEAVLDYLSSKFRARFGTDSIVGLLIREPKAVFQRLISIQGASPDRRESQLYDNLASLSHIQLDDCRKRFLHSLDEYARTLGGDWVALNDSDVLFDIPGRRLDTAGDIYIALDTGGYRRIADIPGPVQRVVTDFERLAKRMRVFLHPRLTSLLDKRMRLARRGDILRLLEDSLPTGPEVQVR